MLCLAISSGGKAAPKLMAKRLGLERGCTKIWQVAQPRSRMRRQHAFHTHLDVADGAGRILSQSGGIQDERVQGVVDLLLLLLVLLQGGCGLGGSSSSSKDILG